VPRFIASLPVLSGDKVARRVDLTFFAEDRWTLAIAIEMEGVSGFLTSTNLAGWVGERGFAVR